jgi:hypothetical protein
MKETTWLSLAFSKDNIEMYLQEVIWRAWSVLTWLRIAIFGWFLESQERAFHFNNMR